MEKLDNPFGFLANGGRIGRRIRKLDWSRHPLGPVDTWNGALQTSLGMVLGSTLPTWMVWGADLTLFFNDACVPLMGDKVFSLGSPYPAVWHDTWDSLRPTLQRVLGGESFVFENCAATVEFNGCTESARFTFSYAPLRDGAGMVGGLICICSDVTGTLSEAHLVPVNEHHHGIPAIRASTMAPAAGVLTLAPSDP